MALHVFASPAGVVEITPEPEGTRIRGRFAGGSKATESHARSAASLGILVEGVATGKVELLVLPVGSGEPPDLQRILLEVTAPQLPQPPPRPQPVDELAALVRWVRGRMAQGVCRAGRTIGKRAIQVQSQRPKRGYRRHCCKPEKTCHKDLLQQQFDEVGGERWTAEKHAAWLRRFQR
ncbi:MAG UNVERIFIED_CONTAM: hypothetical protein LVR18_50190 [Planctomycetaceae bacterium]